MAVAALVPCDASTVSKIEAGQLRPTERFVTACVETFPPLEWLARYGLREGNGLDGIRFLPVQAKAPPRGGMTAQPGDIASRAAGLSGHSAGTGALSPRCHVA